MQEEVEARQQAEAEAARLAEEQRIRVDSSLPWKPFLLLSFVSCFSVLPSAAKLHVLRRPACVALLSIALFNLYHTAQALLALHSTESLDQ